MHVYVLFWPIWIIECIKNVIVAKKNGEKKMKSFYRIIDLFKP